MTRQYIKEQQTITVLGAVHCNKCERPMRSTEIDSVYGLQAEVRGQYGSPSIPDGLPLRFDLCEFCLTDLFKTFKLPLTEPNGWNVKVNEDGYYFSDEALLEGEDDHG